MWPVKWVNNCGRLKHVSDPIIHPKRSAWFWKIFTSTTICNMFISVFIYFVNYKLVALRNLSANCWRWNKSRYLVVPVISRLVVRSLTPAVDMLKCLWLRSWIPTRSQRCILVNDYVMSRWHMAVCYCHWCGNVSRKKWIQTCNL